MKWSRKLFLSALRQLVGYLTLFGVGVTLGVLILAFLLAGDIYDYSDTVNQSTLPDVDAIVCLGGGRGRIAAAGDLWYRYWELTQSSGGVSKRKVPTLYFSGMGRQVNWNLLSKQIRKGVVQKIQLEDVLIEKESSNTEANAHWLVGYAQQRHWERIVLLTSGYHMKRARFIFDHVLKTMEDPIELETFSVYQEPFAPNQWRRDPNGVRVTLLEYLKWVYYKTIWRAL